MFSATLSTFWTSARWSGFAVTAPGGASEAAAIATRLLERLSRFVTATAADTDHHATASHVGSDDCCYTFCAPVYFAWPGHTMLRYCYFFASRYCHRCASRYCYRLSIAVLLPFEHHGTATISHHGTAAVSHHGTATLAHPVYSVAGTQQLWIFHPHQLAGCIAALLRVWVSRLTALTGVSLSGARASPVGCPSP
ncbi:hypothetical protein BDZ89DRAFT_1060222 [Hymenopellis radicata]|nr:hypothetical protein BDZ89DRAFT_1060222 [Hymenopellis radicata]